jgi:hypothetical protein
MIKLYKSLFLENPYKISNRLIVIIFFTPIIMFLVLGLLFAIPSTRGFGIWLVLENNPIELLTFIIFLIGGVFGINFTITIAKFEKKFVVFFYAFFSICLIILAMEEISWGQSFFHFKTPQAWKEINFQGETTLHNLKFMQSIRDNFLLIFGLSGLFGIFLRNFPKFKKIGVPKVLISWFLMISVQASLDILVDFIVIYKPFDNGIERLAELTELLIAGSAFLYLWMNLRKFIEPLTHIDYYEKYQ